MTVQTTRALLAVAVVTLVLAGATGPVGGQTTTAPAPQQPLVTELDLQASLTGELFVVAGWFEFTALVDGRLNTSAQDADLGSTFDVDLAESFGEFAFRGQAVGTVDASRVLVAVEGNASSLGRGGVIASPTALSAPGGGGGTVVPDARALDTRGSGNAAPAPVVGPAGETTHHASPVTPMQIRPFRWLGISFLDLYWQIATLVLGLLVVGVLPNASRRVADLGAGDPVRTGGAGLAVAFLVPVALLVLGLSLFGIPLAVAGAAVYLVLWWVGAVYGRFTVGLWLLGAVHRSLAAVDVEVRRIENRWAGLLVGVGVVGLLVQLPVVGPIVESLVLLLGLGAISRLAYRSYQRTEREERTPPVETVPDSEET